jgi:hypothetical protein
MFAVLLGLSFAAVPQTSSKPDLSKLTSDERQSIELACVVAKTSGPAAYNQCLTNQLAQLSRSVRQPDLSSLSSDERQSIELACVVAKTSGPAAYNQCLTNQLAQLSRSVRQPDLSSLSSDEHQSIELACVVAKTNGPAAYNQCLANQLAQLSHSVRQPDLSSLSSDERQSIELACVVAKTNGPAAYNQCLTNQLAQLSHSAPQAELSQYARLDTVVATSSVSTNAVQVSLTRSSPELRKLDYFRGNWTVTGEVRSTLFEPKGSFTGEQHNEWAPDGLSLISVWTENRSGGTDNGKANYTYDPGQKVYTFDGTDSHGEEESATGVLTENTWTWTSNPTLSNEQTVTARFTIREISPSSYAFKYEVAQSEVWDTIFDGKATKAK